MWNNRQWNDTSWIEQFSGQYATPVSRQVCSRPATVESGPLTSSAVPQQVYHSASVMSSQSSRPTTMQSSSLTPGPVPQQVCSRPATVESGPLTSSPVPQQVYHSASVMSSQSSRPTTMQSRSFTPSPVPQQVCYPASVTSLQSSRQTIAESRSLNPSPVSFCSQGSLSTDSDDGSMNRRRQWSRGEVLALLDLYEKKKDYFKDPKKRNKDIWGEISDELNELGFAQNRNAGDCESKFKNLKRVYISTVDHNNTSGKDPKTCAFFEEMSRLFQRDVRIKPVAICSSRAGLKKPSADSTCDQNPTCSESENEDLPRKRKKKSGGGDDLVTLFKDFTKSREDREKERMQELKEMHTEKMTMMGRFLQVFQKSVEKE